MLVFVLKGLNDFIRFTINKWSVVYYDDYSWNGNNSVSFSAVDALEQEKSEDVKGLVTGQKMKVLGITSNQWLLSATYYDSRYCMVQQVGQLYPYGIEVTTNVPDFAGNIIRVKVK